MRKINSVINRISKMLTRIENIYIGMFLIYLILNNILPYVDLHPAIIRNIVSAVFVFFGLLLSVNNFFLKKNYKDKNLILLLLFIVSAGISSLTMIKYGIVDNLKTIIWSIILYCVVFEYARNHTLKDFKGIICKAFAFLTIIWCVCILVGLYQYVNKICYFVRLDNYPILKAQGFYYNRLFGIFVDPNFSAVCTSLLLIVSAYIFSITKKKLLKNLIIISMIIEYIYIVLSGSRSGLIVLFIGVIVFIWLIIRNLFSGRKLINVLKIIVVLVVSSSLYIGIYFGTRKVLESVPNLFPNTSEYQQEKMIDDVSNNNQSESSDNKSEITHYSEDTLQENTHTTSLDRSDLEDKDITNLRLDLWLQCINMLKDKLFFGTSPRNLIEYAKDKYPDTYPATGVDFGNGYIAVLSGTGIVGALFVVIFLIICIKDVFKYIFKNQYIGANKGVNVLALSIIFMMAIAAAINLEIFLVNTFSTAIFWLMLGYILNTIGEVKENHE